MKHKFDLNIDYGQIFLEVSKKNFIFGDLYLENNNNYLKFDYNLVLNKDYFFYFQLLKYNNIFYLENLNNSILIEHSFFHKDRIILRIKENTFFVIFEFLNNNYLPIKKIKIKDLFFMLDLYKNYFFINNKYDLEQINNILINLNLDHIYSKFFLFKIVNKCNIKKIFTLSLYGFNLKKNKFKFIFYFEIYFLNFDFIKIYKINEYLSFNLIWKIKNVLIESILNKYYWLNNQFNLEIPHKIYDYIKLEPYDDWKLKQFYFHRKNKFNIILEKEKNDLNIYLNWLQLRKNLNKQHIIILEEFLINLKLKECLFKYIKFLNEFVYINIVIQIPYLKSIGWKKWYGIFVNNEKNILLNKQNFKNFCINIKKFKNW